MIFIDWSSNKGNVKGRIVLVLFRLASVLCRNKFIFLISLPYLIFYRVFVEWILSIEIPMRTTITGPITLFHGQGTVINDQTVIGSGCILRHGVTIGVKSTNFDFANKAPVICDNVDIGANVVIIGNVSIGNNVIIGAGSIVVRDVPDNAVVVGNPARIIKYREL